jgi:hypothetical protein
LAGFRLLPVYDTVLENTRIDHLIFIAGQKLAGYKLNKLKQGPRLIFLIIASLDIGFLKDGGKKRES